MKEAEVRALFLLAGIDVERVYEIANRYWPDNEHYAEIRRDNPWWLVKTKVGLVRIGWRKRVISIDWEDTPVRLTVTFDDVTKGEDHVHAWGHVKALEYLAAVGREINTALSEP